MTSVSPTRDSRRVAEGGAEALRTPSHGGADGGGASEVACEVAGAGESTFQGTGKGDAWRRSSEGWLVLLSPVHTWARLWRTRELLWGLSTRAIAERHKGSALGLVWLVVQPLLMLSVYTFVFSVVWRATWTTASAGAEHASAATASGASAGMLGFASMVFAGLVVYEVFSTSVAASPSAIVQNPNYVKKVVFPVELLPLSNVVSACLLSLVGVGVLVVGRVLMGEGVSRTLWLLPVVVLPVALLAAGISLIIAALATYFRDIRPIVQGVMLQVLFFMTPIFYPMERVPAWLRESLQLNPLAGLVQQARGVLVLGAWPDWQQLLVLGGAGLVVFQVGYAFFMRAKRGFADVL